MKTTHEIFCGDSRFLTDVEDSSVELVVTSPPYPMVEMWDDAFASQSKRASAALSMDDGDDAFEAMHDVLGEVWTEVERVLVDGGLACINIGDATRTIGGEFQLYPNHVRVIDAFRNRGFVALPDILWRKPANSAAKFMGSGMRPPNAYVTLEHEYILVFRKGGLRAPDATRRDESAYFWEERNEWFSDVWTDVNGVSQSMDVEESRNRSGAFPFDIPYRLINMFSVQGDTVLDPFVGTGTTTVAAMCSGRNSVGSDVDAGVLDVLRERVQNVESLAEAVGQGRLSRHRSFVENTERDFKYDSAVYDFEVTTKAERHLSLPTIGQVNGTPSGFEVEHGVLD